MKSMTHLITRSRLCGFNMVELMVAMAIGLVLSGAGITVYVNTRATIDVNQAVSRLQENARYAIDELTRDLRLSGYWGRNNAAEYVDNRTGEPGALLGPSGECAAGWYNDLDNRVEGLDDTNATWATCIPNANYSQGDILAMRFVDPTPIAALTANTVYLRSSRNWGKLFTGTGQPTIAGQNYRVGNRAYYVSPFLNTAGDGIPALMRVVQADTAGGVALQPEIVISGVENLQVQYAVDTDGNGSVDQYLNGNGGVNWSQVEALRLWVLVRADTVERGYTNNTAYQLAEGAWTPNDGFRRVLLTKTIRLRN